MVLSHTFKNSGQGREKERKRNLLTITVNQKMREKELKLIQLIDSSSCLVLDLQDYVLKIKGGRWLFAQLQYSLYSSSLCD